jgi:hypothetical protein
MTTTLAVTVYPFVYDEATRRGLFFDTYAFEVDHGVSPVGITRLATDRAAYEPGETVFVDLELENGSAGRDAAVAARVVEAGTGAEVAGLALRTLKAVEGRATYRAAWESEGAAPGSYTVRVELMDGPFPLDAEEVTFRLGRAGGVVRELTVPGTAEVGEDVALSLTFENTGTVALTGTVVVEVYAGGQEEARFEEGFEGVGPGEEAGLMGVWEDVGLGDYAVVGYALFEGEATAPVSGMVRVGRRVYLPVVVRCGQPQRTERVTKGMGGVLHGLAGS